MNREQLEHALRAAASITGETTILVIGSQSILGSYSEDDLPAAATKSLEIDLGFFNDPDGYKADLIEGAIGEDSDFDQMYGYYVDGVDTGTATLPHGLSPESRSRRCRDGTGAATPDMFSRVDAWRPRSQATTRTSASFTNCCCFSRRQTRTSRRSSGSTMPTPPANGKPGISARTWSPTCRSWRVRTSRPRQLLGLRSTRSCSSPLRTGKLAACYSINSCTPGRSSLARSARPGLGRPQTPR
jgi:hypothetical protein